MVVVGFEIWYLLMWSRLAREKVFFIKVLPPPLWSRLQGVCRTEACVCLFVCSGKKDLVVKTTRQPRIFSRPTGYNSAIISSQA